MTKPQYGILRFAKYKGPEIGRIEAHNERTKENYASNPDVDTERSKYNFHLVKPNGKYRAEAEKQIAEVGCRTRTDSVRVVETLITASPDFFKDKKKAQIKEYFEHALNFILKHVPNERFLSAVIHVDEKTPHMHLSFVPITDDGRLSAKDIVGNRKKLTWWQDEFWKHMVKKYPDMERGESASETGREHIPPRLFKEAIHLNRMKDQIMQILADTNVLNKKTKTEELEALLKKYIPSVEQMKTKLKKYDAAYKTLKTENEELEKKLDDSKESTLKKLEISRKLQEYEELKKAVENIPPEILGAYKNRGKISTQIHE
ncbi:MAG: plasmid recombination protein [Clostridia bacterium]|nr:plasmid recombination protein [Clostridia bacterium]